MKKKPSANLAEGFTGSSETRPAIDLGGSAGSTSVSVAHSITGLGEAEHELL